MAHFLSAPEISHDHECMTFTAHFPWIPENVFTCPVHFQDQGHTTHFNTT